MLANGLQKKGPGRGAEAEEVEELKRRRKGQKERAEGKEGKERLTEAGSTPEGI
jgi:hypothetical protein